MTGANYNDEQAHMTTGRANVENTSHLSFLGIGGLWSEFYIVTL